ncbi:MAG: serine/threonine protein kinase, partial [Archangium sp.]
MTDATLLPERLGKYEVLARLSIGGMAELFLGCLPGPGGFRKFVAIKQILPDVRHDEQFVKMFLDEARISAALVHPNIGQVYELGADEGGELFLAMEFIAGQNLARVLRVLSKSGERIPVRIACRVIRDVCLGLHAAHTFVDNSGAAHHIIHRDVSPKNVMLSYAGQVKVIDFGIAKARGRLIRTMTGVTKGTLSYMAPEQVRAETIDARTDLFAAGAILWETLTGERVFAGTNPSQAILNGTIAPPSDLNPEVPATLDDVVLRALARDPAERYPTGKSMAKAIADAYPDLADDEELSSWLGERFATQLVTSRELFSLSEKSRLPSRSAVVDIVQRLADDERAVVATPMAQNPEAPPAATASKTKPVLIAVGATVAVFAASVGIMATTAPSDEPTRGPDAPQPITLPNAPKRAASNDTQAILDAARRAQTAADSQKWREANDAWNDVLLLAPNNFAALMGSGIALVEQKRWREGLSKLEQAAQLAEIHGSTPMTTGEVALYRAKALFELERLSEATGQLQRAVTIAPQLRKREMTTELVAALAPAKRAVAAPAAASSNQAPKLTPSQQTQA